MSSSALAVQENPQSVLAVVNGAHIVKTQREAIVSLMRDAMQPDIDYGRVPGSNQPSLYKPGSEKLLAMFHLAVKPVIEDLSTPDRIRYQVHVIVTEINSGRFTGEGIGEASSAESKYQWRAAVCDAEFEETALERRRLKWKKGNSGPFQVKQVRADMEDIANTVLKVAKKRAQIDAVLTCTAASSVFAQDLEDLPEGTMPEAETQTTTTQPATLQKKADAPVHPPAQQQTQHKTGGPVISEGQARRFYAIWKQAGKTQEQVKEYLGETFAIDSDKEMPVSGYEKACAWADKR